METGQADARKDVGELLLAHRLITQAQLRQAREMQAGSKESLQKVLIAQGFVTEEALLKAVAAHRGLRPWHLERDPAVPDALAKVPADLCRTHFVLPVKLRGDLIVLAMRAPDDMVAIEAVRSATELRVEPVLADEERLFKAIETAHGGNLHVDGLVQEALTDVRTDSNRREKTSLLTEADTRPVVGLVNQLLTDAIRLGASDVHIEPRADRVEIRYRVDGQLRKTREIPATLLPMLTTRLKIMAELDIVEYRVPQDGRMTVTLDEKSIDVRVSVLPNYHGQRIVLRILDGSVSLRKLEEIGFSHHNLTLFRSLITKPYGMVLVTGPTGSGKTTTLYAALNELRQVTNNIMTCEDPVEYDIDGISQSQVNDKVGLTFAAQLRATLRQDPDIILVGEIRDKETAETAIRAALTGHLVFSTLHCNDAPSAVPRMVDMGVDPYLLSTSLIGVVSQRLLRRLCTHCKQESELEAQALGAHLKAPPADGIYGAVGCKKCSNFGYTGRMAVHEILPVSRAVASAIARRVSVEELRLHAEQCGYRPMQLDALDRVWAGDTTLAEAQRHVFFDLPHEQISNMAA